MDLSPQVLHCPLLLLVIEEGKQSLMVMGCFSPTEIYLALKGFPKEVINKLHELGANSDYVHLPKDGDLFFVFKEQCWNRAKVVRRSRHAQGLPA